MTRAKKTTGCQTAVKRPINEPKIMAIKNGHEQPTVKESRELAEELWRARHLMREYLGFSMDSQDWDRDEVDDPLPCVLTWLTTAQDFLQLAIQGLQERDLPATREHLHKFSCHLARARRGLAEEYDTYF